MIKNLISIFSVIFFISCISEKDQKRIPSINLDEKYELKEFSLQTIANVKYLSLETDSIFLLSGRKPRCISKDYIIFYNKNTGALLAFNHTGKKAFSFNKKGMGPEEYIGIGPISYDEKTSELYCSTFDRGIKVYSKEGKLQRNLPLRPNTYLENRFDYNDSLLVCWNNNIESTSEYYLLHKSDSSRAQTLLTIPFDQKIDRDIIIRDNLSAISTITPAGGLVFQNNKYFIAEPSLDTVYELTDQQKLVPIFYRTPSVKETNPPVLLDYGLENDDYIFMTAVEREYNFQTKEGLNSKSYLLEKATGQIYSSHIYNEDYPEDPDFNFSAYEMVSGRWVRYFTAEELLEAFDNHKLSGELKIRASQLKEEDNGILMMIDFI